MPLDLFASARSTALVAIVATATLASPVVIKSDAIAGVVGGKSTPHTHQLVAGGVEFVMPAKWGRLGSTAAKSGSDKRIGTVVSAVCPGGAAGASCSDGVQLTFIAYGAEDKRSLPILVVFEQQLDAKLEHEFPGFVKGESKMRPGADSIRYLDYAFTWREGRAVHHQRMAVYRNSDGSGVVVIAAGAKLPAHTKAISGFLTTAHEAVSEKAH